MCFTAPISFEFILAASRAIISNLLHDVVIRMLASLNSIGGKGPAAASQSGSLSAEVPNDARCQIFKQLDCNTFRIHTRMIPITRLPNSSGKSLRASDLK
jgi:hypothetical protein